MKTKGKNSNGVNLLKNWIWNFKTRYAYIKKQEISITKHDDSFPLQVVICDKAGSACVNDGDAPESKNEGAKTVCNQIYRTQKILAVDETGN